jgi:hypothetical protein
VRAVTGFSSSRSLALTVSSQVAHREGGEDLTWGEAVRPARGRRAAPSGALVDAVGSLPAVGCCCGAVLRRRRAVVNGGGKGAEEGGELMGWRLDEGGLESGRAPTPSQQLSKPGDDANGFAAERRVGGWAEIAHPRRWKVLQSGRQGPFHLSSSLQGEGAYSGRSECRARNSLLSAGWSARRRAVCSARSARWKSRSTALKCVCQPRPVDY